MDKYVPPRRPHLLMEELQIKLDCRVLGFLVWSDTPHAPRQDLTNFLPLVN